MLLITSCSLFVSRNNLVDDPAGDRGLDAARPHDELDLADLSGVNGHLVATGARVPCQAEVVLLGREAREQEAPDTLPRSPQCPFCAGQETEIMNAFGAHASVSSYWCRACRSPFEMMKWRP